jgi:hypothetical protein
MQTLLIKVARDKQLGTDSFHMMGSSRTGEEFPVNSYVLYKPPDGSRTKLQMPKAGPFIAGMLAHLTSSRFLRRNESRRGECLELALVIIP